MSAEEQFSQEVRDAFARYCEHADLDVRILRRTREVTGSLIGWLAEVSFYEREGVGV